MLRKFYFIGIMRPVALKPVS